MHVWLQFQKENIILYFILSDQGMKELNKNKKLLCMQTLIAALLFSFSHLNEQVHPNLSLLGY